MTFAKFGRISSTANYLPFDVPAAYPDGAPMVFAHYFTQFPLRLSATPVPASDTVPGYYYQNYYAPGVVENGVDHRRYGGFTRDYPMQSGLTSTSTSGWEQKDMESEVRQAMAGGIGGWTIDMLSIRGYDGAPDTVGHWTRIKRMFDAVDAVNAADGTRFRIMLMPDGTSGSTAWVMKSDGTTPDINASADALANAISQLAGSRTMYRREGKLMVGPFAPEKWPTGVTGVTVNDRIAFWNRFKATMQSTYGYVVGLWMCYVEQWNGSTCAPLFNTVAYGHGRWGDRDATSVNGETTNNRLAAVTCRQQFGKPWMHFGGSPMDTRPSSAGTSGTTYRTWESWGTRTIDGSWRAAIDGQADCNQIVTWNDYTEHAHVAPSRNNSFALLDLQYYYITRYRGGYYPAIVRDCLYLTHRVHRSDAQIASNTLQVAFTNFDSSNLSVKNDVEVVAFATGPCTVEILNSGTVISTQTVTTAGVTVLTTPLPTGSGTLSARMKRDGNIVPNTTVTSNHSLQANPVVDDYHYRSHSSLRQATFAQPRLIMASAGKVMRNNVQYRTAGVNAFQLIHNDYPSSRLMSHSEIDSLLDKAVTLKAGIVRAHTLGVNIGSSSNHLVTGVSGTTNPTITYNSNVWEAMDYAVKAASDRGLYFMVPMTDELGYYHGGKRQWVNFRRPGTCSTDGNVKSANSSAERTAENYFYSDSQIKTDFKKYLSDWLNHVNQYTGRAYKDEPAIAIIETGNELWTADDFRTWTPEIGAYIKSIAPNVLVADGMAADGSSYWSDNGGDSIEHIVTTESLNSTGIDIVGIHPYSYFTADSVTTAARRAAAKNKAFNVGEYAWSKTTAPGIEAAARAENNVLFTAFWSLQNDADLHNNGAGYNIDDASLYVPGKDATQQAAVTRLQTHSQAMANV